MLDALSMSMICTYEPSPYVDAPEGRVILREVVGADITESVLMVKENQVLTATRYKQIKRTSIAEATMEEHRDEFG